MGAFLFGLFVMIGSCTLIAISPDSEPLIQHVFPGSEKRYLVNCRADEEYELLLSWPASRPCFFQLGIEEMTSVSRSLLNTEKLVFLCPFSGSIVLKLLVQKDGVVSPVQEEQEVDEEKEEEVSFTVVCSRRKYGIPLSSLPVIVTAVCIVATIMAWLFCC